MHKFAKSLTRVIAIKAFGSSGGKILCFLLDNHPNILTIPSSYMQHFYEFWPGDFEQNRESVTGKILKQNSKTGHKNIINKL